MGSGGRGTQNVGLERVSSSCLCGPLAQRMGGECRRRGLSFEKAGQSFTYRLAPKRKTIENIIFVISMLYIVEFIRLIETVFVGF